jgi:hypothetical protein
MVPDISPHIPDSFASLEAGFQPVEQMGIALETIVFLDPLRNVGVVLQHPDSIRKYFHRGEKTGISEPADTTKV